MKSHSMMCTYPEGCTCGATGWNRMEVRLKWYKRRMEALEAACEGGRLRDPEKDLVYCIMEDGELPVPTPAEDKFKDTLGGVVIGLVGLFDKELFAKSEGELDGYWYFRYDPARTVEVNLYDFYDKLKLYDGFVRQWEEHHNGSTCIVGRVRDKYLMPKVREFLTAMESSQQPTPKDD